MARNEEKRRRLEASGEKRKQGRLKSSVSVVSTWTMRKLRGRNFIEPVLSRRPPELRRHPPSSKKIETNGERSADCRNYVEGERARNEVSAQTARAMVCAMCAKMAGMCGKDAAMCVKDAAMCAKIAAMGAKIAAMCAMIAAMRAKIAAIFAKIAAMWAKDAVM